MSWDHHYRRLAMGEIIRATDEVLTDTHLGWQPVKHTIGQAAPDPNYTSHRVYRRLKDALADTSTIDREEEDLIPFAPEPARSSVRDTAPVKDAQRLAKVACHMKEFEIDRHDAERLIEVEAEMDGSDWANRQKGEQK